VIFFGLTFVVQLLQSPYKHYKEVRSEAEKWLAKLNSQMKKNEEEREQCEAEKEKLRQEIQRLQAGPSKEDLAKNLLEELARNKKLKGLQVGYPERKYLDLLIQRYEDEHIKNELTAALYELRARTKGQEKIKDYSGTRTGQYNAYYLPALNKLEDILHSNFPTLE